VKKMLAFTAILMFCGQAYSSPAVGFRLGMNVANATHGPDYDYQSDAKIGLILGGAFEAAISKKGNRTIRLEAAYVQKGWQKSGEAYGTEVSTKAEIDEFVLTPMVVFRFSDYETNWYILAGMDVGLNIKARQSLNVDGVEVTKDIPGWNSTNVGLDVGAGILYPSGRGEFLTELRFNLGVTDMYEGADWDPMTNGAQLIFGYNFTVPTK
jgi:hypothetical protein